MRNILAALLVGFIVVMTQSGSVIILTVLPEQDAAPQQPGAALNSPVPAAQHALAQTELCAVRLPSDSLLPGKIGPRRGPVK
jgi:hypothetical protein